MELKHLRHRGVTTDTLRGKVLAMIFDKSSTRTRVSFSAGMAQLGGSAVELPAGATQLDRGEPWEDTAKVLSQMVDAVMIRASSHQQIEAFASAASIPVINGLSDDAHPCQLLADIQTWIEQRGNIQGRTVVWLGDGNNVCHSWIEAAMLCDFTIAIVCRRGTGRMPSYCIVLATMHKVFHTIDAVIAAADVVITDVWTSMGQEQGCAERQQLFAPFQVNTELMQRAGSKALFMHCLPAHRGEEVSAEVIDGVQSVVWQEAGNRLHAQKALLEFLLRTELA